MNLKHVFHSLLITISVAVLLACGGDEPIPTPPAETGQGEDTTATEITDSTITDSTNTEKDSLKVFVGAERTKEYLHYINYTGNKGERWMVITD